MKRTGYNQMRDDEKLLGEHVASPPSFTVSLYPSHWTLNNGVKFLYNMPISSLLEDIRAYRIPADFVELFDEANIPYYDGCLIVELLDYRPQKAKDPILENPEGQRVVLRSNPETVWADICLMKEKVGSAWTDSHALEMEARILLATAHPLCLEPDPHLTRIVNNIIRVSTPTMPHSLKRKATAMVDVEEDETEKAKRAKVMQFMNPQANRGSMPFQPSFRILSFLDSRVPKAPVSVQPPLLPQMTRPPSASAYSPANAPPSMIGFQVAPFVAPALAAIRSGSVDDAGRRSSGAPTPTAMATPLPQVSAGTLTMQPGMLQNLPTPIQVPRHIPDPNLRKSPVKRPPSTVSHSMPPPQTFPIRQPTPLSAAQTTTSAHQAQQIRPPSQPQQSQEQPQQANQQQVASIQASPQIPNASFHPTIPPQDFLAKPPPTGKRKNSQAKQPPTPAMTHQQVPQQPQISRQGTSSPAVGQQPRLPQMAAVKAYSQQLQHAAQGQLANQAPQLAMHMLPMMMAQQRPLTAGRNTPITQPGTPQQNHAILNRSPVIPNQNQQNGRNSPMTSGQAMVRSSPLVSNQTVPARSPMPSAPVQAQVGIPMMHPQGPMNHNLARAQYMARLHMQHNLGRSQQFGPLQGQPPMLVQAQGQQGHVPQMQQQADHGTVVPQQQAHHQMSMYPHQAMVSYPYTWLQNPQHSGQQQFPMVPGLPLQQLQNMGRAPLPGNMQNR